MNPEVFGWEHLTYLAVFFVLAVVGTICIMKYAKTEKAKMIVIKSLAGVLLLFIILNRISLCLKYNDAIFMIPDTFCGLSSLLLSLGLLIGKKDNIFLHFIVYISFVGGLLTIFYPDFLGQAPSLFYFPTITGLLHHTLLFYLPILLILTKYFVPTLKKWFALPIGLCCMVTFGEFLISALNFDDAMFIHTPLIADSIFTWWFTGILVLVFSYIVMTIFDYFNIWKHNKKQTEKIGVEKNLPKTSEKEANIEEAQVKKE